MTIVEAGRCHAGQAAAGHRAAAPRRRQQDQRFGANVSRRRPEQRVTAIDGAHGHRIEPADRAIDDLRLDRADMAGLRPGSPCPSATSASATWSSPSSRGQSLVTTSNSSSRLSASISASTAAWIAAVAPEWPRAKAIRSSLALSLRRAGRAGSRPPALRRKSPCPCREFYRDRVNNPPKSARISADLSVQSLPSP